MSTTVDNTTIQTQSNNNTEEQQQQESISDISNDNILHTRVGVQYQVTDIPDIIYDKQQQSINNNYNNINGILYYSYKSFCEHNNLNTTNADRRIDDYMSAVDKLFNYDKQYDEVISLQLLHSTNYNTKQALQLLKPKTITTIYNDNDDNNNDQYNNDNEIYTLSSDDLCSICLDGGDLIQCDNDTCNKYYHAGCIGISTIPDHYICNYHHCNICNTPTNNINYYCTFCTTSYCEQHIDNDLIHKLQSYNVYEYCCIQCSNKILYKLQYSNIQYNGEREFMIRLINILKHEQKRLYKIPIVNYKKLNIYLLYLTIIYNGGIVNVYNNNLWPTVIKQTKLYDYDIDKININNSEYEYIHTTLPNLLCIHYMSILYLYERIYYNGYKRPNQELFNKRIEYNRDDQGSILLNQQSNILIKKAQTTYNNNSNKDIHIRDDEPSDCIVPLIQKPKNKKYLKTITDNNNDLHNNNNSVNSSNMTIESDILDYTDTVTKTSNNKTKIKNKTLTQHNQRAVLSAPQLTQHKQHTNITHHKTANNNKRQQQDK